jgi:hypothetical protein
MGEVAQYSTVRMRGLSPFSPSAMPSTTRLPFPVFLGRIFLWLPDERTPGALAIGLILARQAILPIVLILTPIFVLAAADPDLLDELSHHSLPRWTGAAATIVAFGAIALVEELNRYAFVRRAEQPRRAILMFTALAVIIELFICHGRPFMFAWLIVSEFAASAALYAVRAGGRPLALIVPTIVVLHTTILLTAPKVFPEPPFLAIHY